MKKVIYLTALGRARARTGMEAGADILRLVTAVNSGAQNLGWQAGTVTGVERPRVFTPARDAFPDPALAPTNLFSSGLAALKARLDFAGIVRAYRRKLEEYGPELSGAALFHAWDCAAVLALRQLRDPAVRAKPLLFTPEAGFSRRRPAWLDKVRREALAAIDALVLPGEWARAEIEKEYGGGKRYFTLPRGLEDIKYLRTSSIRAEIGLKDSDMLVCSFGRLAPEKGFSVLVEAMSLAVKKKPEGLYCAIAGAGPEEPALKAAIKKAGIDNRVKLLGFREDAGKLLADSEIFAAPALKAVSDQGLLEAERAGLAIIASEAGGNPEILGWGLAGVLVPAGSASALAYKILEIAQSPLDLVYLSAMSRDYFVKHHTMKALASGVAGIYDSVSP